MKAGAEYFAEDGPGVELSICRQLRIRSVRLLQVSEVFESFAVNFPYLAEAFLGEFGWYRE